MSIDISRYNKDFFKSITGKNPSHCIKLFEDWRQTVRDNIGSQLHETWFEAELKQTIFDNNGNCHMIFEIIQMRN